MKNKQIKKSISTIADMLPSIATRRSKVVESSSLETKQLQELLKTYAYVPEYVTVYDKGFPEAINHKRRISGILSTGGDSYTILDYCSQFVSDAKIVQTISEEISKMTNDVSYGLDNVEIGIGGIIGKKDSVNVDIKKISFVEELDYNRNVPIVISSDNDINGKPIIGYAVFKKTNDEIPSVFVDIRFRHMYLYTKHFESPNAILSYNEDSDSHDLVCLKIAPKNEQ